MEGIVDCGRQGDRVTHSKISRFQSIISGSGLLCLSICFVGILCQRRNDTISASYLDLD